MKFLTQNKRKSKTQNKKVKETERKYNPTFFLFFLNFFSFYHNKIRPVANYKAIEVKLIKQDNTGQSLFIYFFFNKQKNKNTHTHTKQQEKRKTR